MPCNPRSHQVAHSLGRCREGLHLRTPARLNIEFKLSIFIALLYYLTFRKEIDVLVVEYEYYFDVVV